MITVDRVPRVPSTNAGDRCLGCDGGAQGLILSVVRISSDGAGAPYFEVCEDCCALLAILLNAFLIRFHTGGGVH